MVLKTQIAILAVIFLLCFVFLNSGKKTLTNEFNEKIENNFCNSMDEKELKSKLTEEQYKVTQLKATERPFHNKYWNYYYEGKYHCVVCGLELFSSESKFDSGTGWPSFYDAIDRKNIREEVDYSLGMGRTEVICSNCGAHLGHLFYDGPEPTGLRYCINSAALDFKELKENK